MRHASQWRLLRADKTQTAGPSSDVALSHLPQFQGFIAPPFKLLHLDSIRIYNSRIRGTVRRAPERIRAAHFLALLLPSPPAAFFRPALATEPLEGADAVRAQLAPRRRCLSIRKRPGAEGLSQSQPTPADSRLQPRRMRSCRLSSQCGRLLCRRAAPRLSCWRSTTTTATRNGSLRTTAASASCPSGAQLRHPHRRPRKPLCLHRVLS